MNEDNVASALGAMKSNFPKLIQELGNVAEEEIKKNFTSGGRPAWPLLKSGKGVSKLYKTGALFRSIKKTLGRDYVEVSAGRGLKYAFIHNFGGTIQHPGSSKFQVFKIGEVLVFTNYTKPHKIRIPQRRYMMFGSEARTRLDGVLGKGFYTITQTERISK